MPHLIKPESSFLIGGLLLFLVLNTFEHTQGQEKQAKIAPVNTPFDMPDLQRPVFQDIEFNIIAYGALEGGEKLTETAFQEAIDACSAAGGGKVVVPAGKWLTVPFVLKSNVNLNLKEGSEVIFTADKKYYFPDMESRKNGDLSNPVYLISADHCENIAITGSGELDGNGMEWWPLQPEFWKNHKYYFDKSVYENAWKGLDKNTIQQRPQMFRVFNCNNVLLEGITFINSPFWTINPVICENVIIRDVTVLAKASNEKPDTPNTDGINPESCKNVLIENCIIDTGDDSFAIKSGKDEEGRKRGIASENIVIRNCDGKTIAIGSEMSGGVRNVFIHDLILDEHFRIKTRRGRGGVVENIWVQDIQINSLKRSIINIDMEYYTHRVPAPYEPVSERTPRIRNIFIKNIKAIKNISESAIFINGLPEMPIENVSVENAELSAKEGIICNNTNGATFKNISLTNVEKNAISINNSKNISFNHLEFDEVPKPFILLKGCDADKIILDKIWKGQIDNMLFEEGAKAEMIEFR